MSKLIFYLDFGQDCVFSILNITEVGTTGGTTWWWWYPHLPTPWFCLFYPILSKLCVRFSILLPTVFVHPLVFVPFFFTRPIFVPFLQSLLNISRSRFYLYSCLICFFNFIFLFSDFPFYFTFLFPPFVSFSILSFVHRFLETLSAFFHFLFGITAATVFFYLELVFRLDVKSVLLDSLTLFFFKIHISVGETFFLRLFFHFCSPSYFYSSSFMPRFSPSSSLFFLSHRIAFTKTHSLTFSAH